MENYAWNWRGHSDVIQIQAAECDNLVIEDNFVIGCTNGFLLGDRWGSVANVSMRNNFVWFESNGVSAHSRGNIPTGGRWEIANNTFLLMELDPDSQESGNAIFTRGDGDVYINNNFSYGLLDTIRLSAEGRTVAGTGNYAAGKHVGFDSLGVAEVRPDWMPINARDLEAIGEFPHAGSNFWDHGSHLAVIQPEIVEPDPEPVPDVAAVDYGRVREIVREEINAHTHVVDYARFKAELADVVKRLEIRLGD